MTCETVDDLLLDYVEGELPLDQADAVRAHLAVCRPCAARCREMRHLLGDLGAARSIGGLSATTGTAAPSRGAVGVADGITRIGDFEMIEELGRGGMGVVYRARQLSLDRIVALKLLSADLVSGQRSISRFLREARAAARLHHTNIVPIYAQGRDDRYVYYAMELIEGPSLERILREQRQAVDERTQADPARRTEADGPPPAPIDTSAARNMLRSASTIVLGSVIRGGRAGRDFKRVARLVAGVAEGLHHAHEQGVIHRDIKPQNLLLGPDEQLHITDFGLARILDEPGLTRSTEIVGTPAYMAPEQITGPAAAIDRRTDVYALGVTLYEMLTLHRPFEAETYDQTIIQILRREPPPPRRIEPHVPPDLETICLRAMEKEPERRFATAADMARDLRRYAEGFPIVSRPLGPLAKAARWIRRHPWRASATAAIALLVIAVPLLTSFVRTAARAEINEAYAVLLNDYRDREQALARLGWISRIGGDAARRGLVEALADIRTDPAASTERLERILAQRPKFRDAHYLLAWAYARQTVTQGTALWADAQREVRAGDSLDAPASAAGYFFRGQAVWGLDPHDAERSFDQAIRLRTNFTQAMLHQGRAMNQIMYTWRDVSYYRKAVGRLESVALVQPARAYPRYLLSITHLLAAEIYAADGRRQDAERAWAASLAAAREAQVVQSSSPRGYAAEAGYYESRGRYASAVAAWDRLDNPAIHKSASDWAERYGYEMRLLWWLGRTGEAEHMLRQRYGPKCGYDPQRHYDPDESFYAALLAATRGNRPAATRILHDAAQRTDLGPEARLLLDAAFRLIDIPTPKTLLPRRVAANAHVSPGWSVAWTQALVDYARGVTTWDALAGASQRGGLRPVDARLRMTAAYFFRGVYALAAGRRNDAHAALRAAAEQRDNENYCFRARLLQVELERAPGWVDRLRGRPATAPAAGWRPSRPAGPGRAPAPRRSGG